MRRRAAAVGIHHNASVTRQRQILWLVCSLTLLCLVAVSLQIHTVRDLDKEFLRSIHRTMGWRLSRTMLVVNLLGSPFVVAPVSAVLLVWTASQRAWRECCFVAITMGGIAVANVGLRAVFHRHRPELWPSLLPNHSYAYSFPSGHASILAALMLSATVVLPLSQARRLILVGVVVAVGCTTLGLGVHYLTDVLAGWLLALSWTLAMALSLRLSGPAPST